MQRDDDDAGTVNARLCGMKRTAVLAVILGLGLAALGCNKKEKGKGLPPASSWGSGGGGGGGGTAPGGAGGSDPHAGLDMGGAGDPHAGLDMGGGAGADPHAGLDMGGGGMGGSDTANPHGGGGGMGDPAAREPDPNHFLRGTLTLDAKVKGKVPAGAVLFLSVRRPDGAGNPERMPIAAKRFENPDLTKFEFDLNEGNSEMGMVPDLTGDVWVVARVDADSNATTHQAGDLVGQIRVKAPAKDLKLVVDRVLATDEP
jgi:hypothetical protein